MVVDVCERCLAPIVDEDAGEKSRSSLYSHLGNFLQNFHVSILKHGGYDLLLEGRKVLGYLSIDIVVLLPQL